jgi:type II secretory pathway pseudopilin PulG
VVHRKSIDKSGTFLEKIPSEDPNPIAKILGSMSKPKKVRKLHRQAGMTLIEVMISTGLVGIMMFVIMALLGQVGGFVSVFNSQASTIEAVASTVGVLNSTLPLVTRVEACNCRTASGTRATCIWEPDQPWYDPVINGAQASPVTLLQGEFEAHGGPDTSLAEVLNISTYQGIACESHNSDLGGALTRGCKQKFSLRYTAPTSASATVPSNAGLLELNINSGSRVVKIGEADADGMAGVGVTELSCGFDSSGTVTGGAGLLFVLNMRIKAKSNNIRAPTHPNYESWYPGRTVAAQTAQATKNFIRGQFRELRLKFAMRNISTRGIYSWRAESIRNCKRNGQTATNFTQCCSQALSGGACVACTPGGTAAGAATACCSGTLTGGVCE